MLLISWSDEYSLHIEELDKHHKKLIDIINKLNESIENSKGSEGLKELFEILIDYCSYHFSEEEHLMEEINYPDYDYHKQLHKDFKEKILKFQNNFLSGEPILRSQILNILKIWFEDHIVTEDKKISTFMDERGKKEDR